MGGCALFLVFIAAGAFTSSVHKWQELGLFGTWSPVEERPWQNRMLYDLTGCCSDKTNRFFVLLRALFGWQDTPSPLEALAYTSFWLFAAVNGLLFMLRSRSAREGQAGKG